MIKIRLKRIGRKKRPFYHIVIMDSKTKRNGKEIDKIGYYDPLTKVFELNEDRVNLWKKRGAQNSDGFERFLRVKKKQEDKQVEKTNL